MHRIKGKCVKVIDQKTRPRDGQEPKEYKVLQVVRHGDFVHEITGTVESVKNVNVNGVESQGIILMCNGGQWMRLDKIVDDDLEKKYPMGKEVTVHGVPEVKNNKGKAEVFFKAVDENFKDGELNLASIRDWQNGSWAVGKELSLDVKFRPYLGQRRNGLEYRIQD